MKKFMRKNIAQHPAAGLLLLTVASCAAWGAEPWAPRDSSRQDDRDSPYVPARYERTFTANFLNPNEEFNRVDNPWFTTANFRLNPEDLNTCRRLGANKERQLYVDQDFSYDGRKLGINPFAIKDGILSITALPLSGAQKEILAPLADEKKRIPAVLYSSGMLSTETQLRKPGQGFTQLYGYWELRARLPKGKGLWPGFWLVGETHEFWDEVDIFEVLGDHPRNIYQSAHLHAGGGTDGMKWPEHTYTGIDSTDGFHVYGLLMTTNSLRYYVDGVQTLELAHTLKVPLYVILNLGVGGSWGGDPDSGTVFPASMNIDYLRIYKKRDEAGGPRVPETGLPRGRLRDGQTVLTVSRS